jgi:hypothetical protein
MEQYRLHELLPLNQLVSLGTIFADMCDERPVMDLDREFVEFIYGEYDRIEEEFLELWATKPLGMSYGVDFHLAETNRLSELVANQWFRENAIRNPSPEVLLRLEIFSAMQFVLYYFQELLCKMTNSGSFDLEALR